MGVAFTMIAFVVAIEVIRLNHVRNKAEANKEKLAELDMKLERASQCIVGLTEVTGEAIELIDQQKQVIDAKNDFIESLADYDDDDLWEPVDIYPPSAN